MKVGAALRRSGRRALAPRQRRAEERSRRVRRVRRRPSQLGAGAPARGPRPTACRRTRSGSRSARALREALARHGRGAIVLAPGAYRGRRPFLNPSGHRLYAARPGRAVLRAGLSMGGNSGPGGGLVRGLVVDVARRPPHGRGSRHRGVGHGPAHADPRHDGQGPRHLCGPGSPSRRPDGLRIRRLVARGFTDAGCSSTPTSPSGRGRASRSRSATSTSPASRGRDPARRTAGPRPASGSATRERCGACACARARWSGLWTGTAARRARFEDIDIDGTPTGVYVEHFTRDSTFRRLRIGPDVRIGLPGRVGRPGVGRPPGEHRQRDRGQPVREPRSPASTSTRARRGRPCGAAPSRARRGRRSATTAASATPSTTTTTAGSRPARSP